MTWSKGTTYDESAVPAGQEAVVLEALSNAGFCSLELALHERALSFERARTLCRLALEEGFDLAFHAPDFCDPSGFDLNAVMSETGSKVAFSRWLDQCGSLGGSPQVIFHGASERDATLRFIDWALEHTEKNRSRQWLLLENTYNSAGAGRRYGQLAHELLEAVQTFEGGRLGLCLDTAHWLRTAHDGIFPVKSINEPDLCEAFSAPGQFEPGREASTRSTAQLDGLLKSVHRLHLHSVEPASGLDHQPLTRNDLPTRRLLEALLTATHQQKISGPCCSLEILKFSLEKAKPEKPQPWLDAVLSSGLWLSEAMTGVSSTKDSRT